MGGVPRSGRAARHQQPELRALAGPGGRRWERGPWYGRHDDRVRCLVGNPHLRSDGRPLRPALGPRRGRAWHQRAERLRVHRAHPARYPRGEQPRARSIDRRADITIEGLLVRGTAPQGSVTPSPRHRTRGSGVGSAFRPIRRTARARRSRFAERLWNATSTRGSSSRAPRRPSKDVRGMLIERSRDAGAFVDASVVTMAGVVVRDTTASRHRRLRGGLGGHPRGSRDPRSRRRARQRSVRRRHRRSGARPPLGRPRPDSWCRIVSWHLRIVPASPSSGQRPS